MFRATKTSDVRDGIEVVGFSIPLLSDDGGARAEVPAQLSDGDIDRTNAALPSFQGWWTTGGLDGTGLIAAPVDEGVDETHLLPPVDERIAGCWAR